MRTVSRIDRWFDDDAEGLLGLPVAEAVHDVMLAGLHVEVARPEVRRVRDGQPDGVALVVGRQGVVVDVLRLGARPSTSRDRASA